MLSVTTAQLNAWLAMFMWPFIRILGLMIAAPLFGNQRFPLRMRVGLALLITLIVAPTLPPMPQVAPDSLAGLGIFVQQLLLGLAMGFALRVTKPPMTVPVTVSPSAADDPQRRSLLDGEAAVFLSGDGARSDLVRGNFYDGDAHGATRRSVHHNVP